MYEMEVQNSSAKLNSIRFMNIKSKIKLTTDLFRKDSTDIEGANG